jgi:adenosylcobyric acid synthase
LSNGQRDGAVSADGRVVGTYVHGLFVDDRQRARWLKLLGAETSDLAYEALVDDILDRFADHLEAHLDCELLLAISAR